MGKVRSWTPNGRRMERFVGEADDVQVILEVVATIILALHVLSWILQPP